LVAARSGRARGLAGCARNSAGKRATFDTGEHAEDKSMNITNVKRAKIEGRLEGLYDALSEVRNVPMGLIESPGLISRSEIRRRLERLIENEEGKLTGE